MCPQAALPDLNTAWIMDKREFLNAIKTRNYTAVVGSLYSINAALPKDYRVEISDKKYQDITRQDLIVICNHCHNPCEHCETGKGECTEIKYHNIKIQEILTNNSISTITGQKLEKVWECPKCHKHNMLSKTDMIQTKLAEPYFLKVIPGPPTRRGTLTDRNEFHKKMEKWAYQFYDELAHQMSNFRLEYKPKSDEEFSEFIEGGEEGDV